MTPDPMTADERRDLVERVRGQIAFATERRFVVVSIETPDAEALVAIAELPVLPVGIPTSDA